MGRLAMTNKRKEYWEGYYLAYLQAALMTDMSTDKIILGYHDALSKAALMKDLNEHFVRCSKIGYQNMQSS